MHEEMNKVAGGFLFLIGFGALVYSVGFVASVGIACVIFGYDVIRDNQDPFEDIE